MQQSFLVLISLIAYGTIVSAQLSLTRPTYLQPHEAWQKYQQLKESSSLIANSEEYRDELNAILQAIVPEAVLKQTKRVVVSDMCANQTLYMLQSSAVGGPVNGWALDMLDAWGKPTPGIRRGALTWLGDFEECQSIRSYYNSSDVRPENSTMMAQQSFEGKYCNLGATLGSATTSFGVPAGISLGSCFPSGCSEADITNLISPILNEINANLTKSVAVTCQEKDMPYSTAAIITIVLYCVMGAICLSGTLYDFVFIMTAPAPSEKDGDVSIIGNGHAVNGIGNGSDTEILITAHERKVEHKPGALGELLMCFSLYTNGYKLLSTKQAPGSLTCLNGIRFISMTWVILGHTLVFSISSIGNFITIFSWTKRFSFLVISNATVSVDSFFVLSALLTSYLLLKDLDKRKTTPSKFFISVPIMYLHRYIRLTPAYGFMILFYACLGLYTYSGPLKPVHTNIMDVNCEDNWWGAIFYTNNVIEPSKMCAGWGWYLSNDFQFYLVTPFIVYLMYLMPIVGFIVGVSLVVISAGAATGISVNDDLGVGMFAVRDPAHPGPGGQAAMMQDYYFAPWARYQSFGVGVLFGFFLWKCKGRLPFSRMANLGLWGISAVLMLSVLYGAFEVEAGHRIASVTEAALYNGWNRTAWSIGLGYIMLACCLGRGGWVNEFLSWPGFVPLSRMTYCAYLVHPVIMTIISASHKSKTYWDDITYIYMFAGYVTLSYAVAFLFSLMFEAPFMLIDRKYLTGRLSKSAQK